MQTQELQIEIDILRRQLDDVRGERDSLASEKIRFQAEASMLVSGHQEQGRELVRLRAECESRKGELVETVRRAGQAMEELNGIILKLHSKIDELCDAWQSMLRMCPMEMDARERWLQKVDAFRSPPMVLQPG